MYPRKLVIPMGVKMLIPIIAVLAVSSGAFAFTPAFTDGSSDDSLSILANYDGAEDNVLMTLSGTAQLPLAGDIASACGRDGYSPSSLTTAADGSGTAYAFGHTIDAADVEGGTLYVQWDASDLCIVLYIHPNFPVSGEPYEITLFVYDEGINLPNEFDISYYWTRDGYYAKNYNTHADGSGNTYSFNQKIYTGDVSAVDQTLHIMWYKY